MVGLVGTHTGLRVLLISALAAACSAEPSSADRNAQASVGKKASAIELYDLGRTYGFAFVPPAALAPAESLARLKDRLQRQSFPTQATGAVIVPLRDAAGAPVTKF